MKVQVFDVGHGFSALATGSSWERILVGCGHNTKTDFHPSKYLQPKPLDLLIIDNLDQDHLSDFCGVALRVGYRCLVYNFSLMPATLRKIKAQAGPLTLPMSVFLLRMKGQPVVVPRYTSLSWSCFWIPYPVFDKTNHLSVVTFLEGDGVNIVFPGDLPSIGWKMLLQRQDFRDHLSRVNVFVASHHGRKDGYCQEVFDVCSPGVIIISDGPKEYDSQEVDYGQHAKGVWHDGEMRYTLTTRQSGTISIESDPNGLNITTSKNMRQSAISAALLAHRNRAIQPPPIRLRPPSANVFIRPPEESILPSLLKSRFVELPNPPGIGPVLLALSRISPPSRLAPTTPPVAPSTRALSDLLEQLIRNRPPKP